MRMVTPRKTALGYGTAGTGTDLYWFMTVSSIGLAVLTPSFLMVMGTALQLPTRLDAIAYFSRPYPAVITGIYIVLGMVHFMRGMTSVIDDYTNYTAKKIALILNSVFGWSVIAFAAYALVRLAVAAPIV